MVCSMWHRLLRTAEKRRVSDRMLDSRQEGTARGFACLPTPYALLLYPAVDRVECIRSTWLGRRSTRSTSSTRRPFDDSIDLARTTIDSIDFVDLDCTYRSLLAKIADDGCILIIQYLNHSCISIARSSSNCRWL